MSKRKIMRGTTGVTVPVFIQSTVDGSGLAGLTSASAGLLCKYRRQGGASWTTITLSAGTLGTWSSGGFIVDTNGPAGTYELGIPDAALGTNSWVMIALWGAANMAPVMLEFELDAINYQDGVRLGLTALPNLAAGANGGLPLSMDANGRVDLGEWLGVAPLALDTQRVNVSVGFIQNGVVSSAAIGTDAITSAKIANNTITSAKIATDAIGSAQIATGAISSATFGAGAINAAAIATNAITSAKIATDAIGNAQLATDAITSAQIAGSAVAEIQGLDSGGVTTLLTRLGTPTTTLAADTTALVSRLTSTRATNLDNLDTTVSSRSTYAGADTSGTTTLLGRLTSTRAGNLDNLDAAVSGLPLATWNILRSVTFGVGSIGEKFKAWMADLGSDNRVKVTADAHTAGATIAAVSGDTKQTGDAFARIGTNGAGLTALGDTRLANLDATVSSRNATTPPTATAIRTELDSNSTKLANLDATISSRSTYNGTDTTGTTTLLSRLTAIRAGLLDNLDAAISSVTGGDGATAEAVALAVREELATELARLDAAISTRSTYAGSDTSGTTTLLERLNSTRATNLDNLDAPISTIESGNGESSGVTTLLERLTETRASNLDNLDMPISDLPTADEVGDELVGVTVGSVVI